MIVDNCAANIEANRPIGATVTLVSATGLSINVSAEISIDCSTTKETVQTAFTGAQDSYPKSIAFSKYTLIYNCVAVMLMDIDGVTDYTTLP